jgi:hypothetical protein
VTGVGDVDPLSGFDTALVQMRRPDGTVTEWAGQIVPPNVVRGTWPQGIFTTSGLHRVRAKLTGAGVVEHTTWVRFWVRPA